MTEELADQALPVLDTLLLSFQGTVDPNSGTPLLDEEYHEISRTLSLHSEENHAQSRRSPSLLSPLSTQLASVQSSSPKASLPSVLSDSSNSAQESETEEYLPSSPASQSSRLPLEDRSSPERSDSEEHRTLANRPAPTVSAVQWIESHLLRESVCQKCAQPAVGPTDGKSLNEIVSFFRDTGLPDVLKQAIQISVPPPNHPLWKTVLAGTPSRPSLEIHRSDQHDLSPVRRFDVDAFIAEATSLEALRGLRFSYYPRPMQNLHQPIHISFHGRALHHCRHIRFGEGLYNEHLWVYIAFPQISYSKETYLSKDQHALWIDKIVLPSLREILPPTLMQHYPSTWAFGAAKMRAKNNEHRTWDVGGINPIHYAIREEFLPGLWERMLEKLHDPRLADFRGMFIVLQTYGTKLVWNHSSFSQLRREVQIQLSRSIRFNHLNLSHIYVDLGKESITQSLPRIHWWKHCCLNHWWQSMAPKNHTACRYHPISGLRDAGAMNIHVYQTHPMASQGLVYAQRYSNYKEIHDARKVFPFTNKNIESLLIPPDLLQL